MKNDDFQKYFDEKIISVTPYFGGLTNKNYIIKTTDNKYFFRLPNKDIAFLFDREKEYEILQMVKPLSIDIDYLFFDSESGIKISKYYPNLLTYSEYKDVNKLQKVATLLKKLHSLKTLCSSEFSYLSKLESYKKNIEDNIFDLSDFTYLETQYLTYFAPKTLCHNDCVNGNLLFSKENSYLIDYEYAGDNYPIFDVTSFTTENDLNPDEKGAFYKLYYGKLTPQLSQELILFEKLHHYLWCHWAMMMYKNENKKIYKDIAFNKYKNLTAYQVFTIND